MKTGPGRPRGARRFEREVRNVVVGGLAFVLFLAGVSLVVLRNTLRWGVDSFQKRAASEARAVARLLSASPEPGLLLSGDPGVAALLRADDGVYAALYDGAGSKVGDAPFLRDPSAAPDRIRPSPAEGIEEDAKARLLAVTVPAGAGALRLGFDAGEIALARRNVRILSIVVPAAALALLVLVVPFLERVVKPIEALAETARGAGSVVGPRGPDEPGDEAQTAIDTFALTIDELKRRTAELEVLRRREKDRADALGEMSAGIAHEFRNATATILGYARLAGATEEPAARARHLEAIRTEAEHVARVTGDFLFFARPERLLLETVDVARLVDDVVSEHRLAAPALSIERDGSFGTVTGDAALLRRALVNLLRNASEAALTSVVVRGESPGDCVRLAVEDDGPGVSEEDASRVFVPFFSTKESGTGLGLALVARIVTLHGGSVVVEKAAGLGGARFVLTLPAGSA